MIFRQLFDPETSTYSYLLGDGATRECLLIDPVLEQFERDRTLIEELGLRLASTLETHVHADHVTASGHFRSALGSRVVVGADSGVRNADVEAHDGCEIPLGGRSLEVRATPGHTAGCVTYVLHAAGMAFTGDALLIRGAGRTDFQQGNATTLFHSVTEQIFTLPEECLLYPAHDYRGLTATSVYEEKRFNPRLGGERNENDFVGYMKNLNLPHPKQIDEAVPANLECGAVAADKLPHAEVWAPLRFTYAGVNEIDPDWVAEHRESLQIVDVRGPSEFTGILGHIEGASMIPLSELEAQAKTLGEDTPIVTVCRSGGRSAQAVILLQKAGFTHVANLAGGMINWNNHHLPVSDGT